MARLPYLEKETATADQEKILAQVTQKTGKIANMWKLFAHSAALLEAFLPFNKAVAKAGVDPKLRELAYMMASRINGCAYCFNAHKIGGVRAGVTEDQVAQLESYSASNAFSLLEKTVLRFADEVTRSIKASDEIMAEMRRNFSEAEIVELTVAIGLANLTNRFNMTLGTDPD
jgi:uncharacterized peroxidase-related enzyme